MDDWVVLWAEGLFYWRDLKFGVADFLPHMCCDDSAP